MFNFAVRIFQAMTEKKEHIINAAIELFAEKGFEGTSIRDLAARAEVNVAMVNYYFGSKDKLFETIVEHRARFMRGRLDEIASNPKWNEEEKINAVIEAYVDKVLEQPSFHKILYQELMLNEKKPMHDNIATLYARNIQTIKDIIAEGIKKKVFRKVDPQLTIATLMGSINQVILSKTMCTMLVEDNRHFDPHTDPTFRTRLIKHLKQLMHAHLLLDHRP